VILLHIYSRTVEATITCIV
jgi:hypothetical protein